MPTRDEVLAASGRELDKLVHQLRGEVPCKHWGSASHPLLGLSPLESCEHGTNRCYPADQPRGFSSQWGYAGPLLEEMCRTGAVLCLQVHDAPTDTWRCAEETRGGLNAKGSTPQEAIARAYCLWKLERGEQP